MPFPHKKQKLFVEAGSRWLKWAVLSALEPKIAAAGVISLEDRQAASAQLASIVKKFKLAPEETSCCLSRSLVTARNLELPSTDPAEIKNIVGLQAVKQTPYTAEEIVFDYSLLSTFREGYSSLMLVIAHRDVLNAYLSVIQGAGLKSPLITLGTECSAAWIQMTRPELRPGQTYAALDVDAESTDFFIFRDGAILFTQNLPVGADRLKSDSEAASTKLTEEVTRAYQIYRSEEISTEPSVLVFAGAHEAALPLKKKIVAFTDLPVQECGPPADFQKALHPSESPGAETRFSFSAVLGLALRPKAPPINLVPQEMVIQESLVQKSRSLFVTGLLCLSIFLVLIASFAARYYEKSSYLKWLENQASASSKEASAVDDEKSRVEEILRLHDESLRFFDDLHHLTAAIPAEIYMTEISMDDKNHFSLQGRSDSMTGVFDFVKSLQTHPAFKNAESKRLTKRIVANREVVDFEIDSRVSP